MSFDFEKLNKQQQAVLTAGTQIAKIIAARAPVEDYTPIQLEKARSLYTPDQMKDIEENYCEFETFFVLSMFFQDYRVPTFADRLTQVLLYHNARKLDKRAFRENPYLAQVKIPTVKEGKFTLTEGRYAKGELFQYDMPDFDAEYIVPKLGFFTSPVRFPAIYEGTKPWMSVCPSEILSMQGDIAAARGKVLVLGLGLGYYPFMISGKMDVEEVTVVERSPEIVKLFEENLLPQFPFGFKIETAQCDAYDYLDEVEPGEFDFIYCDLWMGAADGVEHYRRLKEYEAKFPGTEFRYWIEPQLKAFA